MKLLRIFSKAIRRSIVNDLIYPIKTIPGYKLKAVKAEEADAEVKELLGTIAETAYIKMLKSERGQEILAKANQYNIPYNQPNINWLQLIDQVDDYEELLSKADEYNIAWDIGVYDPEGLKQEIEHVMHHDRNINKHEAASFFASRGVEV